MKNKKYYPYKRNNYYYGKLLTVRDFEDEQKYLNDKRRINNALTTGVGVAAGLSVILIDDRTVSVEAGMALDCLGREIIVETAVTKKLNVIDGFESLNDEKTAYLCIEYHEEPDEPAYSVIKGSEGAEDISEYSRVKESYRLFLTNEPIREFGAEGRRAEAPTVIFDEMGVKITLVAPRFVNPAQNVELKVKIEKTRFHKSIEADFLLTAEHFTAPDGNNYIHVYYRDDELTEFKTAEFSFFMTANDVFDTETEIKASGTVKAGVALDRVSVPPRRITITKENIYDVLMNRDLSINFDDALNLTRDIPVCLAGFRLLKNENGYLIKELETLPFKQYIVSNETLYAYMRSISRSAPAPVLLPVPAASFPKSESGVSMNCGEEQIEIEMRTKNKTYFSGEIAHGLGKGDVYVQAGVVDFANERAYSDVRKTILGDPGILAGTQFEAEIVPFSTAVILYPEKETFRIAVKFFDNAERDEVSVKWWAIKSPQTVEVDFAEADNVAVSINEKSVTLSPKEKFKFSAAIEGTDNKDCKWSVVDKDGGEIDINGIYEAPGHEGVFEIMAQSVKYPHKRATTFVVVR